MSTSFERTVLPDGPRVISTRMPGSRSLSLAVYVLAGSRLEAPGEAGVAHFMEHVTFKGTSSFPSPRAVSEAIESRGGSCNAATDRESTIYWARLPLREAERAFSVLSELIVRPLLRDVDIAREREIIIDEIRSYRDDPGQYVFNIFDRAFFGDTPLGWEIAGDEESVKGLTDRQIRAFWASTYRPANLVVAVAGDLDHRTATDLVAGTFGTGDGRLPDFAPAPSLPVERLTVEERDSAQAHLCLGLPALPRDDPGQWALELLNGVLGEGSSSRLFQKVREDAALAYDVNSFQTDLADCGTLQIYAGVDPSDLRSALSAILDELRRLREEAIPTDELERARSYISGRLELRMEETRHVASWLGVQEALHDRVLSVEEVLAELNAVTAADILALAQRLIREDRLCLAVISPGRAAARLGQTLKLD